MQYKIITPVATEPVTLSETKLHLRLTQDEGDTTEDSLLLLLISAAREYCENFTGRALAEQTVELFMDQFPHGNEIELPKPPLQSVLSIKYKDERAVETLLSADMDYLVDDDGAFGAVVLPHGKNWPAFAPYPIHPIRIRYIAGYSESNAVPLSIKQAMLLLIGHWYANREAVLIGSVSKEIELAVKVLLRIHKVRWL